MAKTPQNQDRKELKKHSAAIQFHNTITLLQRKTWNALLWNAYEELPTKDMHTISVPQLRRLIGYDSKDEEYLKDTTLAMMQCIVEWNILGKDGSHIWGAAVLLASVEIDQGICSYGFAPHLRQKLYNPDMFARLDLDMQKRFDSKYALALWELCTDYLGGKRDQGETPWIPLEAFRKLLGIAEDMYPSFKRLREKVITPAIDAINRVSDFAVTVEYQHHGRKVLALKCKIRRQVLLATAGVGTTLVSEQDDMPAGVRELHAAGLSLTDAWDIIQQGFHYVQEGARPPVVTADDGAAFAQYVREKIHLLTRQKAAGKVHNSTGFLLQALRRNYSNPEFALAMEQETLRQTAQITQEREARRKALETQKAALEHARDTALEHCCASLAHEEPGLLEHAAQRASTEIKGFALLYDRAKSVAENYEARPFIRVLLHPYLQQQRPDHFRALEEYHAAEIAAIVAQIQAL